MRAGRWVWVPRFDQVDFAHCSLAVQPVDEFTGERPLDKPTLVIEREVSAGVWTRLEQEPVRTPSGILAFLRLERRRAATGVPPVNYRFTLESPLYVPAFRQTKDWESTTVAPWDDVGVPSSPVSQPLRVPLYPSIAYPFDPSIPVIRGTVRDSAGRPVRDALVSESGRERVLTDERGQYALPLRWLAAGVAAPIDAKDRQGRTVSVNVTLPTSLHSAVNIQFP